MAGRPQKYPKLHDLTWLVAQLEAGRTRRDIASEIGCNPNMIAVILHRKGLRVEVLRTVRVVAAPVLTSPLGGE